jgi:integrase
MWDSIQKKINVAAGGKSGTPSVIATDNITVHMLRHTYCTMLYYSGVDIKQAQTWMGHTSIQMTMGIYTHLEKNATESAVEKLENYLTGGQLGVRSSHSNSYNRINTGFSPI